MSAGNNNLLSNGHGLLVVVGWNKGHLSDGYRQVLVASPGKELGFELVERNIDKRHSDALVNRRAFSARGDLSNHLSLLIEDLEPFPDGNLITDETTSLEADSKFHVSLD